MRVVVNVSKDKLTLFASSVELSEHKPGENLVMKIVLCDFDKNANDVQLNRETIGDWMDTATAAPIVAKVAKSPITGDPDFTSHNVQVITNEDGEQEIFFDTYSYGKITVCEIAEIKDKEHLVITAEVFARHERVIDLIIERNEDGGLFTSWEIQVTKSHKDGTTKVIDEGIFLGHTLLGKHVRPAYDCAKLLEVAEAEADEEFNWALFKVLAQERIGDGNEMKNLELGETPVVEATPTPEPEPPVEPAQLAEPEPEPTEPAPTPEPETSALTDWDIYMMISDAVRAKFNGEYTWVTYYFPMEQMVWVKSDKTKNELDYIELSFVITVDGKVELSEPTYITLVASPRAMSAKLLEYSTSLVAANERIQALEADLAGLAEFRAEREAAERQTKEAEISALLLKGGFVKESELTGDESIRTIVSSLNFDAAKILLADRMVSSLANAKPSVDTAAAAKPEPRVSANLVDESPVNGYTAVRAYLFSKE